MDIVHPAQAKALPAFNDAALFVGHFQVIDKHVAILRDLPCMDQYRSRQSGGELQLLNTDRQQWPSAPASSFAALGGGSNVVWVDPEHDLVVVLRWIQRNAVDGMLERVLAAVEPGIARAERLSQP